MSLQGPSGSGLESHNVLQLSSPYTPDKYVQAVDTCGQAGMQVIIIESIETKSTRNW